MDGRVTLFSNFQTQRRSLPQLLLLVPSETPGTIKLKVCPVLQEATDDGQRMHMKRHRVTPELHQLYKWLGIVVAGGAR